jgi:hypothetical protein
MIASALAALLTTAATVSGTVALFTGPVTLVLPVATSHSGSSSVMSSSISLCPRFSCSMSALA